MKFLKISLLLIAAINISFVSLTCRKRHFLSKHLRNQDDEYNDSCQVEDKNDYGSKSYVTDIKVHVLSKKKNDPCDNGFVNVEGHETPQDLNRKGKGKHVYLCVKVEKMAPGKEYINDYAIAIKDSKEEVLEEVQRLKTVNHMKYCSDKDLNEGVGGTYIRLCWSKSKHFGVVKGIEKIYISADDDCPSNKKSCKCNCDKNLNEGNGMFSWNLWFCVGKS